MSIVSIRSELKIILESITGIGTVHDYIRHWAGNERSFRDKFETSEHILHAWQITRRASDEKVLNQNVQNLRRHDFLFFGVYGLKDEDASEKTFQDFIEIICNTLRINSKQPAPFSGTVLRAGPPQVERVEHKNFNGKLVHSADLSIWVDEFISF